MLLGEYLGIGWEDSGARGRRQFQNIPSPPDSAPEGHLPSARQALQGHCHPRGLALPGKGSGKDEETLLGRGFQCDFISSSTLEQEPNPDLL